MTVENAVATAELNVNVFPDFYDSNKVYLDANSQPLPKLTEWIAYNLVIETPSYADDWDAYTEREIDVHYFTRSLTDVRSMTVRLRNALRNEGYIIQQTQRNYESDTKYYHLIISIIEQIETEV